LAHHNLVQKDLLLARNFIVVFGELLRSKLLQSFHIAGDLRARQICFSNVLFGHLEFFVCCRQIPLQHLQVCHQGESGRDTDQLPCRLWPLTERLHFILQGGHSRLSSIALQRHLLQPDLGLLLTLLVVPQQFLQSKLKFLHACEPFPKRLWPVLRIDPDVSLENASPVDSASGGSQPNGTHCVPKIEGQFVEMRGMNPTLLILNCGGISL